ncbi:hypothetical protein ABT150_41365 [Streptomyces mirabilis]
MTRSQQTPAALWRVLLDLDDQREAIGEVADDVGAQSAALAAGDP